MNLLFLSGLFLWERSRRKKQGNCRFEKAEEIVKLEVTFDD
jgi:hypothetical protein